MRALVTGGAGFIGAAVARALLGRGDEVVVFDDLSAGTKEAVPEGADLVIGDIRNRDALAASFDGVAVVFHHAAVKSVPRSLDEPDLVNDVNSGGTLNVLQAAERAGVQRVIYASSSSVYGGSDGKPSQEDDAPDPMSPYAVSKLAGEYYCRVWASLGKLSTVTLRYFNVFGPGQRADSKYAAVFPAFISAMQRGEQPVIYGDGEQTRDFTFVDDVVDANLLASSADNRLDGKVINVAGGDPRTINQVFEAVRDVIKAKLEPERLATRAGDIRHSYADPSLARDLLGWGPRTKWSDAVPRTVEWFGSQR